MMISDKFAYAMFVVIVALSVLLVVSYFDKTPATTDVDLLAKCYFEYYDTTGHALRIPIHNLTIEYGETISLDGSIMPTYRGKCEVLEIECRIREQRGYTGCQWIEPDTCDCDTRLIGEQNASEIKIYQDVKI